MTKNLISVSLLICFLCLMTISVWAEKAGEKSPKEAAADLAERGMKLLESGERDKAMPLFEKAISLDPKNEEAWIGRGKIFVITDKLTYAVGTYKRALQSLPNSPMIWFHYGVALGSSNQHQSAISAFNSALKAKPDLAEANRYKGYSLVKLYRFNEAIPCFQKVVDANPEDLHAKLFLGIALFNAGQKDKGKILVQEVLRKKPQLRQDIPKSMLEAMEI